MFLVPGAMAPVVVPEGATLVLTLPDDAGPELVAQIRGEVRAARLTCQVVLVSGGVRSAVEA